MPPHDLEQLKVTSAEMGVKVNALEKKVDTLVTQIEFIPVKMVVYGMVGIILVAAIAALVKVIMK